MVVKLTFTVEPERFEPATGAVMFSFGVLSTACAVKDTVVASEPSIFRLVAASEIPVQRVQPRAQARELSGAADRQELNRPAIEAKRRKGSLCRVASTPSK